MFKTRCKACGHRFSQREALCDDWRDPEKAHGCPKCETFYVRTEGSLEKWNSVLSALFGAGIMYPAVSIWMNSPDQVVRFQAGIILVSVFLIAVIVYSGMPRETKRSPWTDRRKQQDT